MEFVKNADYPSINILTEKENDFVLIDVDLHGGQGNERIKRQETITFALSARRVFKAQEVGNIVHMRATSKIALEVIFDDRWLKK